MFMPRSFSSAGAHQITAAAQQFLGPVPPSLSQWLRLFNRRWRVPPAFQAAMYFVPLGCMYFGHVLIVASSSSRRGSLASSPPGWQVS